MAPLKHWWCFLPFKTLYNWSRAPYLLPVTSFLQRYVSLRRPRWCLKLQWTYTASAIVLDSRCSCQWAFRLFPGFSITVILWIILVHRILRIFMFLVHICESFSWVCSQEGNCKVLSFSSCTSWWKIASQNTWSKYVIPHLFPLGLCKRACSPQPQHPMVWSDLLPFARFVVLIWQLTVISFTCTLFSRLLIMLPRFSL